MRALRVMTCIVALVVCASPSFAQKTTMDYDHGADFTKYATYAWSEGTPVPEPLQHQRVVSAIESELASHGFTKVESNPDVFVTYHASATEQVQYSTTGFGYNYGRRWRGGVSTATTTAHTYEVGTLVVDMWQAEGKTLVWQATATQTLKAKPEKRSKQVAKAVEKMFVKYPPGK